MRERQIISNRKQNIGWADGGFVLSNGESWNKGKQKAMEKIEPENCREADGAGFFTEIYRGSRMCASFREGSGRDDESLVSRGDSGWATEYDRLPIGHSFRPPQLPNMKVAHRISRGF